MKLRSLLIVSLCLWLGFVARCAYAQTSAGGQYTPPVMGWSSWNTYHVDISDSIILSQADAMIRHGLKEVGYRYINIDDGFFGGRDAQGRLLIHPARFPRGLKPVVDSLHAKGLRAGIYSDAGVKTCGSIWDHDTVSAQCGLYGHDEDDLSFYFAQCGFDFIKVDFCGGLDLGLSEQRRYTEIAEAIRRTGRKGISYNICRWAYPGAWAAGQAASWRISGDIAAEWNSVKQIIGKNLYLAPYARNGRYNDMDMLEIGRGLTRNEEIVHFGMWCMMASPLLIGCDMNRLPDTSLALLKNRSLIALNQDPLGLQAYVVQHIDSTYVLVKDIGTRHGRERAVALYNPTDGVATFHVPFALLELEGEVRLFDAVAQRDRGVKRGAINQTLPPRSVAIYTLRAAQRVERTHYEAEQAFLPLYDDLGQRAKQIVYVPCRAASGGMKVAHVGGMPDNLCMWEQVYSPEGGTYELTVRYLTGEPRDLVLTVNDRSMRLRDLKGQDFDTVNTVTVTVQLQPGENRITMGNPYNWAPDLDGFTLVRK